MRSIPQLSLNYSPGCLQYQTDWTLKQSIKQARKQPTTEQNPSRQANSSLTSQQIPRILSKPKDHYRAHKSPPHVPILSQINPVHIQRISFKINFNSILPSTSRFTKWLPSLRFSHRNHTHNSPLPHTCHTPHPCHSS